MESNKGISLMQKQLTFWDRPITEKEVIENKIDDLKEQHGNLRRGLFSRYSAMQKEIAQLHEEIYSLKRTMNPNFETEKFEQIFFNKASSL